MLEAYAEILAVLATVFGTLMTLGYIPQLHKIWKRKSVEDFSLVFFVLVLIGLLLWTLYGISIMNWPLIIADGIGVLGESAIIIMYFKYKKR
jgi:MtN3 and saliva related transmembrane protein